MKKNNVVILILSAIIIILPLANMYLLHNLRIYQDKMANSLVYISSLEKLIGIGKLGSTHIHADFKIYADNKIINLNNEQFQAPEFGSIDFWRDANVNKFAHLHPGQNNIDVIHVHAKGVTLGMFFRTIGISLNESCIKFPEGVGGNYCNEENKPLQIFINGIKIENPEDYEIRDLDRILVTYGNSTESNIKKQIGSIGNNACIQSKKC